MRLQRLPVERRVQGEKIACLRDKQGRPIGQVFEARADRIVGRGAGTVLLVRSRAPRQGLSSRARLA